MSARGISEGLAAVLVNGKVGFIDKSGHFQIKPQYDGAQSFSEGLTRVTVRDRITRRQHHTFIDTKGKTVFDLSKIRQSDPTLPTLEATLYGIGSSGMLLGTGDREIGADQVPRHGSGPPGLLTRWSDFNDGLLVVCFEKAMGFVDRQGVLAIPPQFKVASPFSEGLALVQMQNKEFGFIDKHGQFAIKPQFLYADSFSEGLAVVETHERKFGYVNKAGQFVIPTHFATGANSFKEGRARIGLLPDWDLGRVPYL